MNIEAVLITLKACPSVLSSGSAINVQLGQPLKVTKCLETAGFCATCHEYLQTNRESEISRMKPKRVPGGEPYN